MKYFTLITLLSFACKLSAGSVDFNLQYDTARGDGMAFETAGITTPRCAGNEGTRSSRLIPEFMGSPGYWIWFTAGIPRTVELSSAQGSRLQLEISVLGLSRVSPKGWAGSGVTTGSSCINIGGATKAQVEKLDGEQTELTYWAYNGQSPQLYLYAAFEILNHDAVLPGQYTGAFTFAADETSYRNENGDTNILEQISTTVRLDIAHVFDVRFPERAVTTDPQNTQWREIPIEISTNEDFRIRYLCWASGGSEWGVNDEGLCRVAASGPALAVRLSFPHIGYTEKIMPEQWIDFERRDFTTNQIASRKRGGIAFKLQDLENARPGSSYTSLPHFIVEANF